MTTVSFRNNFLSLAEKCTTCEELTQLVAKVVRHCQYIDYAFLTNYISWNAQNLNLNIILEAAVKKPRIAHFIMNRYRVKHNDLLYNDHEDEQEYYMKVLNIDEARIVHGHDFWYELEDDQKKKILDTLLDEMVCERNQ